MNSMVRRRAIAWVVALLIVGGPIAYFAVVIPPLEDTTVTHPVPEWAKVAPEQIAEARKHGVPVAFENDVGMRFVLIPAGTFVMGESPEAYAGLHRDIASVHEVTLSRPYYVGVTEVTNRQFKLMRSTHRVDLAREHLGDRHPWSELGLDRPSLPATQVTWSDAVGFSEWLSRRDDARSYRLPTEAEWERACRAAPTSGVAVADRAIAVHENIGDRSLQAWIGKDVAWTEYRMGWPIPTRELWHDGDDGFVGPAPVATYESSAWGLYDMLGNVSEWCADWYGPYGRSATIDPLGVDEADAVEPRFDWVGGGPQPVVLRAEYMGVSPEAAKVIRGASWMQGPAWARPGARSSQRPDRPSIQVGFRLVSPLPEPTRGE